MDALLNLPDKQTEQGWRDYVLLLFLYNTGARAEEAATLQVQELGQKKLQHYKSKTCLFQKGKASPL